METSSLIVLTRRVKGLGDSRGYLCELGLQKNHRFHSEGHQRGNWPVLGSFSAGLHTSSRYRQPKFLVIELLQVPEDLPLGLLQHLEKAESCQEPLVQTLGTLIQTRSGNGKASSGRRISHYQTLWHFASILFSYSIVLS